MARAAGNNPEYTFVLHNDSTGRYMKDVTIKLPSSSTIVKQTLAAPQLVPWAYRTTRDNIAGLVSVLLKHDDAAAEELLDMLADSDWLEEVLKANRMRPDDVRDESAERGTAAHAFLERLAGIPDPEAAAELAINSRGGEPTVHAVCEWWLERMPTVVASELILPCPQYGYCGTTDLVYRSLDVDKRVMDLKTRRAGLYVYESDEFQVDGYFVAYNLLNPHAPARDRSVLLAFDDGTFSEECVTIDEGAFLTLKAVWEQVARQRASRKAG